MERQAGYASSKGGIVQLTKVLALEWAKYNVRVNALSPAHHKTPLVEQMVSDTEWYEDMVSRIPLGRFGEAYEIIGPAVFLASKASSFMTGSSLLTDGGWTAI
jgi:NAD(P)-dependent dehydrogenase (short-subunit alcohol dehydrogenase family)